jgi:hypothetical protein
MSISTRSWSSSAAKASGMRRSGRRSTRPGTRPRRVDGHRRRDGRARPSRAGGHDLCLLRCAHRAQAEQARGRRSGGQLRNRRGYGQIRSGPYLGRRARRCGRGCRLRRRPPGDGRRGRGHDAFASPAFARRGRVDGPARGARDDSAAPVRRLGMARLRAGDAGHPLERLALPPCRHAQPAPRGGDDGHPDLDRHASPPGCGRSWPCSPSPTPTPTSRSAR